MRWLLLPLTVWAAAAALAVLGVGRMPLALAAATALLSATPALVRMGATPIPRVLVPAAPVDREAANLARVREAYAHDELDDDEMEAGIEHALAGGEIGPDGRPVPARTAWQLRALTAPIVLDAAAFVPIVTRASGTGAPAPGGLPAPPDPGKRSTR